MAPETGCFATGQDLAQAALQGDEAAWAFIHAELMRCSRIPQQDREEVVQDFLVLKVLPSPEKFLGEAAAGRRESPMTYLFRSARNHFCDKYRKKKARGHERHYPGNNSADDDGPSPHPSLDDVVSCRDELPALKDTVADLAEHYRHIREVIAACKKLETTKAPHDLVLLLAERRHVAESLWSVHGLLAQFDPPALPTQLAAEFICWDVATGARCFVPGGPTLDDAWEHICQTLVKGEHVDPAAVLAYMRVTRALWDQWYRRARQHIRASLPSAEDAAALFPHWPGNSRTA